MPQEPTRWLVPKLLALIGVQVALSTKFAEFFDRRDAHAGALAHLTDGDARRRETGRWEDRTEEAGGACWRPSRALTSPGPRNCGWTTSPTPATGSTPPPRSPHLAARDTLTLPTRLARAGPASTPPRRARSWCSAATRPTRSPRCRSTATGWSARSGRCCRGPGVHGGYSPSRATTTGTTGWPASSSSSARAAGSAGGGPPRPAATSPWPSRTTGTCGRSMSRSAPTSTPASSTTSKNAPTPSSRARRSCCARPNRPGPPPTTTIPPRPTYSTTSSAP